ncbi:serine--tRNA ligase, partial [Candidatus Dojkabacteria bacterium]|nr:serine--tRNA ligase [Candidatus Dojkabacteria bacterium]
MLDPKVIREQKLIVKKHCTERGVNSQIVDKWIQVDKEKRELQIEIDNINSLRKSSKKLSSKERKSIRDKKDQLKTFKQKMNVLNNRWDELINQIPNLHSDDVPLGKTDKDNVVIQEAKIDRKIGLEIKDHYDLAVSGDLIDFERGAKVAASQFYYTKNELVLLELAVIQFVLDFVIKKGYKPIQTPDLAKSRYYKGTGYNPKGDESQTYEIDGEDLGLIATAEITMAGYHADEIISLEDLPLKYIAMSHCFRKEAGAYGKYSKGLYRTHQFTKLEMFVYSSKEDSHKYHEEILQIEKELMEELDIPYRVLEMCTGDLGGMAAKKYDIEAWLPGRGDFGEVTSTSNCLDYQARNLNIRNKNKDGKNEYIH